jgi:hypothetical protein
MATANLDELAQLQAMYGRALSPIDRLGAGQVALATNDLEQRQQLAEQARRQLFASQLQQQQQAFTVNRDEARRRELAALQEDQQAFTVGQTKAANVEKRAILDRVEATQIMGEARRRKAAIEDKVIGEVFQTAHEERQFNRQLEQAEELFKRDQKGKDLTEKKKRLAELRKYGEELPESATPFEIEERIQQAAGAHLGTVFAQIQRVGADLQAASGKDPVESELKVKAALLADPDFAKILKKYPEITAGLTDKTLPLDQIPKMLERSTGFFKDDAEDIGLRQLEYAKALHKVGAQLAAKEAENPNANQRPDYQQKLATFKLLNEIAKSDIDNLRNPLQLQKALSEMRKSVNPLPKALPTGGPPLPPVSRGASGNW